MSIIHIMNSMSSIARALPKGMVRLSFKRNGSASNTLATKAPATATSSGGDPLATTTRAVTGRQAARQAIFPSRLLFQNLMCPFQVPIMVAAGSPRARNKIASEAISGGNARTVTRLPSRK